MTIHLDKRAAVRAALRADERLENALGRLEVECDGGVVSLSGEVPDVATKKIVATIASTVAGVDWVDDGVAVRPGGPMSDEAIAADVGQLFAHEPLLRTCTIRQRSHRAARSVRKLDSPAGDITVQVDDGIVSLVGEVPDWSARRIAGALAWTVAGTRDVINWLAVAATELDADAARAQTVRVMLARNPFVDADDIDVSVREGIVTLSGAVPSATTRSMAERDAWLVEGVVDIKNEIAIRSSEHTHPAWRSRHRARRGPQRRARRTSFVPSRRWNTRNAARLVAASGRCRP